MNKILLFVLFLSITIYVSAQDKKAAVDKKPNFNGTWVLDVKASGSDKWFYQNYENYTLIILHDDPQIKIKRTAIYKKKEQSADLIIYTDARGEKNYPYFAEQNLEVESKTEWKKDIIIRKFTEKRKTSNGTARADIVEKYSLSKDEKALILTVSTSSETPVTIPGNGFITGKNVIKWVFRKKE